MAERRESDTAAEDDLRASTLGSMLDADSVFVVDCVRNTRRTLHDRALVAGEFRDDDLYTVSVGRYIDTYVAETDRRMLREAVAPEYMLGRVRNEGEYRVEFRDNTTGLYRFYELRIARYSETEVTLSFKEKDREIFDRKILKTLQSDFFAVFGVDLDTGLMRILKDVSHDLLGKVGTIRPYEPAMEFFSSHFPDGDPRREFFNRVGRIDYLKQRFAEDNKATWQYLGALTNVAKWCCVNEFVLTRHEDGSPSLFAIAFNLMDEAAVGRAKLQVQLQDANRHNELLYEIIDAGKWSFEISENGEVTSYRFGDQTKDRFHSGEWEDPMGWLEQVHPDDRQRVLDEFLEAVRDPEGKKHYESTFRVSYDADTFLWVKSSGRIIWREDGTRELFGMSVNITEQIEEERRRVAEALEANMAKTRFLFNMSHDIRTPLNAILGFTDIARKCIDDPARVEDCLRKIENSGGLLLSLINSVLDMSRVESGKARIEEQVGDILYSFSNIEMTMQELAKARDITLSFEFGRIHDRYVYADYDRCARIFVNIISNAIKYSKPDGHVKVRCEQTEDCRDGQAWYRYTFEDDGIGMSEEFLSHAFEEFSRERNSTTSGIQGTGLGLSLCKSFVELMGGTISCKSQVGVGTTFVVNLPFRVQSGKSYVDPVSGQVVDLMSPVQMVDPKRIKGGKALLVEDNEFNREVAMFMLREHGFEVDVAVNGMEAVEKVKDRCGSGGGYDFVLMDIQMPVMNGYEATVAIREWEKEVQGVPGPEGEGTGAGDTGPRSRRSRTPIIALSANAFAEDRAASLAAGMDDHVAKPIKAKELFAVLARHLRG